MGSRTEDNAGKEWSLVREVRSDDPVYRKFSSIATQEVVERTRRDKFGQETLTVAWSPDSQILAWTVGTNIVSVHSVPQLLPQNEDEVGSLVSAEDRQKSGKMLELDCGPGMSVTSLYFGSQFSDKKWHSGEVKYNRSEEQLKGQLLLAAGLANGDIRIWEVATGKVMMILKDHSEAVTDLQFAPDGSLVLVSASKDCTVKFWDLKDDGNMFCSLIREDAIAKKPVKQICWSPDATHLATVGDAKLAVIYDTKTFAVSHRLQGHQNDVTACRFSCDGSQLYTASFDTRVICWNVKDGSKQRSFEHMNPPPSNIFASGTNDHEVTGMDLRQGYLATICNDGQMRVWDTKSNSDEPITIQDVVPDAKCVSFADNGKTLAIGCQGGMLQLYQLR